MIDGLHTRLTIRRGQLSDVDACQQLTRQYRQWFPFVMRASLAESAERGTLHVAEVDGQFAGFVSFRACRDGWQTIYEIAVDKAHDGRGVGRNLLYSVPTPIRLKCPVDNTASNSFYTRAGMNLSHVEVARRPLNIWTMRVLTIHCQGNNRMIPTYARASGMAYGSRHDNTPRDYVYFQDINWKKYDWADYAHKISTWRPVMAMVADYLEPAQHDTMLSQVADLRSLGVLHPMVCPKFTGAVSDIPADCIVAVSLPSSYAGFVPERHELIGRRIHLLGGNPGDAINAVARWGTVRSADYNVHERNAQKGTCFDGGRWYVNSKIHSRNTEYEQTIIASGAAIRRALNNAATHRQEALL